MPENEELEPVSLTELKDYNFIIPYYQRGYRWTNKNVEVLLDDLLNFIDDKDSKNYYLQPLAIKLPNGTESNGTKKTDCKVIDGQQRLTTLFIISKYLGFKEKDLYSFSYEKDENCRTFNFLKSLGSNTEQAEAEKDINYHYMKQAYDEVEEWFKKDNNNVCKKEFNALFNGKDSNDKNIMFLWYPVNEQDEHKVFENINSGKIQLTNSDLIKALLLCETTGLPNREQVAVQFESMERLFAKDRFWYMLNKKDVDYLKGQSRIDYLFKLQVDTNKEYDTDPRAIFYKVMEYSKDELEQFWKDVRKKFQILQEFYNDIDFYHYIGYLKFAKSNIDMGELINEYSKFPRKHKEGDTNTNTFLQVLKNHIKDLFKNQKLSDYTYNNKTNFELQKIFVLHNIQTILDRYHKLKKNKALKFYYEYFPFELLYSKDCKWDIEHISSQTPNSLENKNDKIDWIINALDHKPFNYKSKVYLESNKEQIEEIAESNEFPDFFKALKDNYLNINGNNSSFDPKNMPIEDLESEDLINSLGNLVLLDSHTNRSFHNSLFPKKRAIVLIASGMENSSSSTDVQIQYLPICTRDVYTKSYSTVSSVSSLYWTVQDAKNYRTDIVRKLQEFIDEGDDIYAKF